MVLAVFIGGGISVQPAAVVIDLISGLFTGSIDWRRVHGVRVIVSRRSRTNQPSGILLFIHEYGAHPGAFEVLQRHPIGGLDQDGAGCRKNEK